MNRTVPTSWTVLTHRDSECFIIFTVPKLYALFCLVFSRSTYVFFLSHILALICRTPLMLAVAGGHVDAVSLLLEREADVNVADNHGLTALHLGVSVSELKVL